MTDNAPKAPDKVYYAGLALVAISLIVYCMPLYTGIELSDTIGLFALNFALAVSYFITLWVTKSWRYMLVFLVLFLISAYSLNRSMELFEKSAGWLTTLLVVYCANLLVFPFVTRMPLFLRQLMGILFGGALVLFVYLAAYLLPVYPVSFIAIPFLGVSLHTFVPVLLVVFIVIHSLRLLRASRSYAWGIGSGVAASLAIAICFAVQWQSVNGEASKSFRKTLIADNTDLPGWVKVAQRLPDNWVTQKYLKGSLIYTLPENNFEFSWRAPHKNFDEGRKHDPLVMFASLFAHSPEITDNERIKILESMYDSRHQAQDRLWAGRNLHTGSIITNMKIWPEQRIAYTEKIINVQNINHNSEWAFWDREEAIYTFHLPEGGVVTSLSLWIDGKEHKGVLTSTHKADSAYTQIVGVENHDPSLVHWQEGNTVSVRVFPVTAGQTRTFKIGITSPLACNGHQLVYDNIWFQGPDCSGASETQQVEWATEPAGFSMPAGFSANAAHRYIRDARYDPDWQLQFNDPGLHPSAFTFGGQSYSVAPYTPQRQTMNIKKVYLDLNCAWTGSELDEIYNMVKDKEVFFYGDNLIPVTEAGLHDSKLIAAALGQRFSLFPFFEIDDPATSLVITKSPVNSPNLNDLKETDFGNKLMRKLSGSERIKLFSIGGQLSPYLKTLKEHRTFDYEQGDLALLKQLVASNKFVANNEDDNHVVIDNAGMALTRTTDSTQAKTAGPDHLMRLFAYNHIMSRLKNKLYSADTDTTLVNESEKAYIVTPVSSLIVLETQADYDRFNISKSKNTLDDATLKSQGAVPEPHEWALIIMAIIGMGWVLFREKIQKKLSRS